MNYANAPAYKGDIHTDTLNAMMSGFIGNTFYVDKFTLTNEIINLFNEVDVEFLAKCAVYAREYGYMREPPSVALAVISIKDPQLFRKIVHRVLKNPKDWQRFIDICRSNLIRRGVGRSIKQEIIKALTDLSVYHAMKYPKAVGDMINIAHPPESVNEKVIGYVKKHDYGVSPETIALSELQNRSPRYAAKLIVEHKLPYEAVTRIIGSNTDAWTALSKTAPHMNLIRNLRNYYNHGVFNDTNNIENVSNKIQNPDMVRRSMLFPFRYYQAYKMLSECYPNIFLLKSLEKAMMSSLDNVPTCKDTIAIGIDISGSMNSPVNDNSDISYCEVAALFGSTIANKSYSTIILPFNSYIQHIDVSHISIMDNIRKIVKKCGGGTSLAAPVEYLYDKDIHVDKIVLITDNMEWCGSVIGRIRQYLIRYPETHVYFITLGDYRKYPTPLDYPNCHYIFGWSDNVLRYVLDSDVVKQIDAVNATDL